MFKKQRDHLVDGFFEDTVGWDRLKIYDYLLFKSTQVEVEGGGGTMLLTALFICLCNLYSFLCSF